MTVYCFGTSFTYGTNKDKPGGIVKRTYCDYLSKELDIPVINYGIPGAHNLEILEAVVELISNKNHYKPSLLIIELRQTISPLLVEKHDLLEQKMIGNKSYLKPVQYFGDNNFNQKYEKYWREENSWHIRDYWNKDVEGYCKINYKHNILFDAADLQILAIWHMIQNVCVNNNIPFKLFAYSHMGHIENKKNCHMYLDILNTFDWKNLEQNIFSFVAHAIHVKGDDWVDNERSSCGHYGEKMHEYLVDTIKDEVKELIGK